MYSHLDMTVVETGLTGAVKVNVSTPSPTTVEVYTCLDAFAAPIVGMWSKLGELSSPGEETFDLGTDNWFLMQAFAQISDTKYMSSIFRVHPWPAELFYKIDVVTEPIAEYVEGRTTAYRLRMSANNAENLSDKVFLYEQVPADSVTREMRDNFVSVCKPGDLETFPADEPEEGLVPPFYRLDSIDLILDNIEQVESVKMSIENDVRELILALDINRRLSLENITRIGL